MLYSRILIQCFVELVSFSHYLVGHVTVMWFHIVLVTMTNLAIISIHSHIISSYNL